MGLGPGDPSKATLVRVWLTVRLGGSCGLGGMSSVPWGLGLSFVLSETPPACKPQEVTSQRDPMTEPHFYLLCQLRCPPPASCLGLWEPRRVISDLQAWRTPGLAGFNEGHTP